MDQSRYRECIDACNDCAVACETCATSCLEEENVKAMAGCIRLDMDCADLCWTASAFMARGSGFAEEICRLCAEICEACAKECEKHDHDHCRKCAEACRRCAEECRKMAGESVGI